MFSMFFLLQMQQRPPSVCSRGPEGTDEKALSHEFESEALVAATASGHTSPDQRATTWDALQISNVRVDDIWLHSVFHMLSSNDSP